MRVIATNLALGLVLAVFSQAAQAQRPGDLVCYIELESKQIIDLSYMCGKQASEPTSQRPSLPRPNTSGLQVGNTEITQSFMADMIKVTGYITNTTSSNQTAGSFQYQLKDTRNNRVVNISRAFVYKDIPPGGQVSFESFVKKADSAYIQPSQLQFQFLAFD